VEKIFFRKYRKALQEQSCGWGAKITKHGTGYSGDYISTLLPNIENERKVT